jgi:hypothetical protein
MRQRSGGDVVRFVSLMTRMLALAGVLSALVCASAASGKPGALYALRYGAKMNVLVPYDPVRLLPSGTAIRTGRFAQAWSVSPDRSRFVAAAGRRASKGEPAALRFVDLAHGRVEGTLSLPGEFRRVTGTAWVRGRVLAVVSGSDSTTVYSIDPDKRLVVGEVEFPGAVVLGERARNGVVLLLAMPDVIGPATVAVVDQSPRVRTVVLDRITAGITVSGTGSERRSTLRRPALALAPSGERAYVVGAHEPAAAVELRTLTIRYSALRLLAAADKYGVGSMRTAATLPDGRLVVSGFDLGTAGSTFLKLVDPKNWSSRAVAGGPWFQVGGGMVFTHGSRGTGLRILKPSGAVVELFRGRSVGSVSVVGPRALVTFFGAKQKAAVIELGTARVVRQTVPAHPLIGSGQPIIGIG